MHETPAGSPWPASQSTGASLLACLVSAALWSRAEFPTSPFGPAPRHPVAIPRQGFEELGGSPANFLSKKAAEHYTIHLTGVIATTLLNSGCDSRKQKRKV